VHEPQDFSETTGGTSANLFSLQPARDGHTIPPFGFVNTVPAASNGSPTTCR